MSRKKKPQTLPELYAVKEEAEEELRKTKKRKNSILQLAIQGKLVKQRKEEGTGEGLFEEMQEEKKRLIEEGKLKNKNPYLKSQKMKSHLIYQRLGNG